MTDTRKGAVERCYPIDHDNGVIQYDEHVFVWLDETHNAGGVGVTMSEALQQRSAYSRSLDSPVMRCPEVLAMVEALQAWKAAGTDDDYYQAVQKRNAALAAIQENK